MIPSCSQVREIPKFMFFSSLRSFQVHKVLKLRKLSSLSRKEGENLGPSLKKLFVLYNDNTGYKVQLIFAFSCCSIQQRL